MLSRHLRSFGISLAFCAALSLSRLPSAQAQSTYTYYPNDTTINDVITTNYAIVGYSGGGYDDNFNPNFTGPSSPTIHIVDGANVFSEMDIFNQSTVYASGGHVDFIIPMGHSTLNLMGTDNYFILNFDQSVINMSSGNAPDLEGQGKEINVSGGTVGTLVANVNTDLLGNTLGGTIVNVTGGEVTDEADAWNQGILNVYGGQFDGGLFARFGGTINIYGSGLSASLLDPNYQHTYSLYSLSGTLQDGTMLTNQSLFIENDGVTYGHSSYHLFNAVPEPGSLALLAGIGATGLLGLSKRHRKALRFSRSQ